jgi:tetratricopeptide (TPR) repeat protein
MPAFTRTALVAFAAAAALAALLAPEPAQARGGDKPAAKSLFGNYMAGRVARNDNDLPAAAEFYGSALARDPANDAILAQSFELEATEGNWKVASTLAARLAKARPDHRMVRLFRGLEDFKAGRHGDAEAHFRAASVNPIGELTANLARAWNKQADGKTAEALELFEQPKAPEWAQLFYRYHRALLLDVAGRQAEARLAYERFYKADAKSLRTSVAYAQHLSNAGDARAALGVLKPLVERARGEAHPVPRALVQQIEAGDVSQLLVSTPSEGLAEAFYGIGEALAGEGGVSPGAIFLQFALYLEPQHAFALATLANIYEGTKQYARANVAYERIPKGTPLAGAIEIRRAMNLNALEKIDEAQKLLESMATRDQEDLKPLDALGTIMRGQKRYEDAVGYYNRAITLIQKPDARHWTYYYARGTSFERLKRWPQAEADLQTALRLAPDEPLVLNYLGYSWIDQGRNLKQGMTLIEKAVKLKPDDGYIVDSLGWAHFKQGNFKEAVKWLERAVEIRPEDPTLNDHLGDAFWRVGREREARFQWEQALTLKPEPEEIEKIEKKLKSGLPALARVTQPRPIRQVQRPDAKRREVRSTQPSPTTQQ